MMVDCSTVAEKFRGRPCVVLTGGEWAGADLLSGMLAQTGAQVANVPVLVDTPDSVAISEYLWTWRHENDPPILVLSDGQGNARVAACLAALDAESIEPYVIMMVRHPLAAAAALAKTAGMAVEAALPHVLWHIIVGEVITRGRDRICITRDALANDAGGELRRLSAAFALSSLQCVAAPSIERDTVMPSMDGLAELDALAALTAVHNILVRWATHGEDFDDYPVLDRIRSAFTSVGSNGSNLPGDTVATPDPMGQLSARIEALEREATLLVEQMDSYAEDAQTARSDADAARRRADHQASENEQTNAALTAADRQTAALIAEITALRAEAHILLQDNAHAQAEMQRTAGLAEDLATSRREVENMAAALSLEHDTLMQAELRIVSVEMALGAAEAAQAELRQSIAAVESRLRQRDAELAEVWSELAQAQVIIASNDEVNARLNQKLKDAEAWVFKLAGIRRDNELILARHVRDAERSHAVHEREVEARKHALRALADARAERDLLKETLLQLKVNPVSAAADKPAHVAEDALFKGIAEERDVAIQLFEAAQARLERADVDHSTLREALARLAQERDAMQQLLQSARARTDQAELENATHKEAMAAMAKESDVAIKVSATAQDRANQAKHEWAANNRELEAARTDLTTLVQRNCELNDTAQRFQADALWMRRIAVAMQRRHWWWSLLPPQYADARIARRLKRHGLFCADTYLRLYPDVAQSGMSAIEHYLRHGLEEQRDRPT